jgi:hypothetical protein
MKALASTRGCTRRSVRWAGDQIQESSKPRPGSASATAAREIAKNCLIRGCDSKAGAITGRMQVLDEPPLDAFAAGSILLPRCSTCPEVPQQAVPFLLATDAAPRSGAESGDRCSTT